jgi:hypothetical protein
MKKIAIIFSVCAFLFTACGDNGNTGTNEKHDEGSEQVQDPVLNSGPETEQERATDAVRDSTIRSDSNAQSLPH